MGSSHWELLKLAGDDVIGAMTMTYWKWNKKPSCC